MPEALVHPRRQTLAMVTLAALACAPAYSRAPAAIPMTEPHPLIIAHRGASGHRPEHTLAAYTLAIEMGADYIEPDLVITRDGVLVARHENEIGATTDVADRFPARRTTKVIDGAEVTGWFVEDFTLAELRTLRARERLSFRSQDYNGQYQVPTLAEVVALADSLGRARGRVVGLYPETKHPSYFREIGLPLEEPLLAELRAANLDRADAPVLIQSFEVGNLRRLAGMTTVRLIQLLTGGAPTMVTPAGLRGIAEYAYGIGPDKGMVFGADGGGTQLVQDAQAVGLHVHVWTLRAEPRFVPARFSGNVREELRALLALGVDGIFADHPDVAVEVMRSAR